MNTQRFLIFSFFILILVLALLPESMAQKPKKPIATSGKSTATLKEADAFYSAGNFSSALNAYQQLILKDSLNEEINYKIGYCYLVTNVNKAKAVKFLETSLREKTHRKDIHYFLGLAFAHAERWDEAIASFSIYKSNTNSRAIRDFPSADRQIEMCNNAKTITKHPLQVTFENPGKAVNSVYEDYNPFVSANKKTLVFTSRRKGNVGGMIEEIGTYAADIYFTSFKDNVWTKAKNVGVSVNTDWDEESVGLTADGRTMLVYLDNIEALSDVATLTLKGKTWQKLTAFGPTINSKNFETGATLSLDGSTLYFASDRKDPKAGSELYYSKRKDDGSWGPSVNLGSVINTLYDEGAPFITMDGKTLYFSSKGHNSMGGFDIFRSTYDDSTSSWKKPENIGYPLNNPDDNLFFSLTGDQKYAYVSALREGGFGDMDIFQVTYQDTTDHPFLALISGFVSFEKGGKADVTKATITDKSTGIIQMTCVPSVLRNEFVLAAKPGTYVLIIEGNNFKTHQEVISIFNTLPLKDMVLNIKVEASK